MTFEEAKKNHCACIYRLCFPDGKYYVGKTKDLGKRMSLYERCISDEGKNHRVILALRYFGLDSVVVDVLSEPKNLSKSDESVALAILEIKYIRENNCIYPNGYNVSIGGEILCIPADCISTDGSVTAYSGGFKPVLVYDLDGNFVKEFDSIEKCAYDFGVSSDLVSSCLDKSRSAFCGKYMLRQKRYGKIPDKIIPFKRDVVERRIYKDRIVYRDRVMPKPKNTILKYNADGEFCGEYDTITDAALSIGRKSVPKGVLVKGYIFFENDGGEIRNNIGKVPKMSVRKPKYLEALDGMEDAPSSDKLRGWSQLINDFKVAQYDLDGNLVHVYDSIRDASYDTGVSYSCIWNCVYGRTRKSRGFIWRKYDK